ncbi:MAG: universal stress protein [Pseudomonadota bacterium]
MYSTILVAVELSPASARLLERARGLRELHDARLVVAHVTEPAVLSAAMAGPDGLGAVVEDPEWDARMVEGASRQLCEMAKTAGVGDAECRVELGLPSETLIGLAKEIRADLLVLGHHPRHGLPALLGGGIDSGVLRHAPCDVLAVVTDEH